MSRNDAIGYMCVIMLLLALRAAFRWCERNWARDHWPES